MLTPLQPPDLHLMFDDTANRCKLFDAAGKEVWRFELRNSAVNNGSFGHFGNCPRGEYTLGTPVLKNEVPFGKYFTPLIDRPGSMAMQKWGRGAIGIHGGGSGLAHPFAPAQGFVETEGCLRCQNENNEALVEKFIHPCHAAGGVVYLTVTGENA